MSHSGEEGRHLLQGAWAQPQGKESRPQKCTNGELADVMGVSVHGLPGTLPLSIAKEQTGF